MGFGFFQGTKIKLLKSILNLNDVLDIRGDTITADKVLVASGGTNNKDITTSSVSTTELGYLTGTTAAIQTQINGKLSDSATVSVTGNLAVTGNASITGQITGQNGLTIVNGVEYANGIYNVKLNAPTLSGNSTYLLPATTPVANGYVLTSTTSGTMSWAAQSGGGATGDIANTNFAVSASTTNNIVTFNSALNSCHIFWSLHNVANDAHQAGNSVAIHKNSSWELINSIAGTATFGGVNLTITSGGVLQIDTPSVTGTFIYRVLTT